MVVLMGMLMIVPMLRPNFSIPRFTKRVWVRSPSQLACRHLLICEKASFERIGGCGMVELLSDTHELGLAVTVLFVPEWLNGLR